MTNKIAAYTKTAPMNKNDSHCTHFHFRGLKSPVNTLVALLLTACLIPSCVHCITNHTLIRNACQPIRNHFCGILQQEHHKRARVAGLGVFPLQIPSRLFGLAIKWQNRRLRLNCETKPNFLNAMTRF